MSQALGDTDLDALAAEYVLGTLGADERTHAQALLVIDDGFATKVRMWERRLGELHLMVEPVDPDAQIWARIKDKFPGNLQTPASASAPPAAAEDANAPAPDAAAPAAAAPVAAAPAAPVAAVAPADAAAPVITPAETPTPAAAAPPVPSLPAAPTLPAAATVVPAPPTPTPAPPIPAAKPAPVTAAAAPFPSAPRAPLVVGDERADAIRRRVGRWRAFATLMTLVVIAFGGLVAAWRFVPERVPPMLQPVEALRAVGIAINAGPSKRPPAPPESRYDE
jgi:hypothetical protein